MFHIFHCYNQEENKAVCDKRKFDGTQLLWALSHFQMLNTAQGTAKSNAESFVDRVRLSVCSLLSLYG